MLRQIKCILRHREALFYRTRNQQDVFGIAVAEHRSRQNIALRSTRRQSGRRPYPLDIPDNCRNLSVVSQPGKLCHQRNAGPRSRRHRACSRPACSDHHADRRQLIFRLHNRKCRFPIRSNAIFLHVVD